MNDIFRRVEKKFLLNKSQYLKMKELMANYMQEDKYGKSTICNIYFDTDQYDLIRHSITKPYYKDKVRLRSYNIPNKDSRVYLEIKRKCDEVVGKRRIEIKLENFYDYIYTDEPFKTSNPQIENELYYYFNFYNLKPAMYVSYEREAFYQKDNMDFRATFDSNILARNYDLKLEKGSYGERILPKNQYILELKTLGAMPLWMVKILNDLKIRRAVYSKYGTAYTELILNEEDLINKMVI